MKALTSNFRLLTAFKFLAMAIVLGHLTSTHTLAQTAQISGVIMDFSDARVPNANVTVLNEDTGISRATDSNVDGFYTVPLLQPGHYMITVKISGFATQVRRGIILQVGAQQVLNITLKVGQVTENIQVTGDAPAVQLASSSIGAVVGAKTVVELPLNGRDWAQLAQLQAAVNVVQTQVPTGVTSPRANRGFGNQMDISGTRPQQNNYRLDGISIVDYAAGAPGSVLGITLGVDAIGEFSVLTSNYSAEYGRTSGGVINAITRSGTNHLHGEAYWFIRDEDFDARNFFDQNIAPFHRNQFGGSLGGPIQNDKTFFFANYEGFRQDLGITNVNNVPSQDARNGIIHNDDGTTTVIGAPASPLQNSAGTVGVDPKVKPFLAFWPLPNAGLVGAGNVGFYDNATNATGREHFETIRLDRKISDKDSVSGTWFYDQAFNGQPDPLDVVLNANTSIRQMISLGETHIFGAALINSLRVGYSRIHPIQNQPVQALIPLAADTSGAVSALPGRPAPELHVNGLQAFLGGLGEASVNDQPWNSYQFYDDAFLTKGVHSLRFGFAFENMRHNPRISPLPMGRSLLAA
jgi:hypothetical protein